jgi:regulator of protease activity HflC (stomatin/prohibitin superfamily)
MLKSRKAPLPPQDLLDAVFEPTLVTGDRNVVQVEMAVRYRGRPPSRDRSRDAADQEKRAAGPGIADLRAKHPDLAAVLETNPRAAGDFVRTQGWNWTFLMPEREAERKDLLEDIFYSSILECVARLPVQDVLTAGRQRMTEYVRRRAQFRLDALGLGVVIDAIEFREVKVPKWVREDFQKVVQAEQLAKIEVSNAESRRSELTTEGQSIADERRKLAAAEADRIVKQARADADTYRKIAAEYRANPELTGERLWNAMMRKIAPVVRLHVVPDTEKVIIQVRSRRE